MVVTEEGRYFFFIDFVPENTQMKTSHAAYNELFVNIFSRALQNICRIINTISSIWRKNVSGYLFLDII